MRHVRATAALLSLAMMLGVSGCEKPPPLQALPELDMAAFEPSVRAAINTARTNLEKLVATRPGNARLGEAYGELAMTYHAQDLVAPAVVAYANARALVPQEKRWPYLQGHLFNDAARVQEAVEAFEAAYRLDQQDPAILQSLGQVYLQTGALDKARALFERLGKDSKTRAAAVTGLGKVALAARDYTSAISYLEEALRLSPGSTRLYQPLAIAYQASGDRAKSDESLHKYAVDGGEPSVDDPAADALADKVAASKVLLRRGQRAGKAGRFDLAEKAFRQAVEADPNNAEAIANLGISLANLDRADEAQQRLEQSVKMDGSIAVARLSLAVLYDRQGRDAQAIEQYEAALKLDPDNVQACVYLADLLMRQDQPKRAAERYEQALDRTPDSMRMRQSLAMAYVKGGRFVEARKILEESLAAQPANQIVTNALARVLATAPDPRARDARRALELAQKLFEATRIPETGQTYAMALAESGRFDEAIKLQQETIIAIERSGAQVSKEFVTGNLARYQKHQPARAGWPADDPVFAPRSPAARRST